MCFSVIKDMCRKHFIPKNFNIACHACAKRCLSMKIKSGKFIPLKYTLYTVLGCLSNYKCQKRISFYSTGFGKKRKRRHTNYCNTRNWISTRLIRHFCLVVQQSFPTIFQYFNSTNNVGEINTLISCAIKGYEVLSTVR